MSFELSSKLVCWLLIWPIHSLVTGNEVSPEDSVEVMKNLGPDSLPSCIQPKNSKPNSFEEHEDLLMKDQNTQLAKMEPEWSIFSSVYGALTSGVSTVYYTAKDQLYSKVSDISSEFAGIVRNIFKNELLVLIADRFAEIVQNVTAPGRVVNFCLCFGKSNFCMWRNY